MNLRDDPRNRELNRDLGLDGRLSEQSQRMMNRDGSFNVKRHGLGWRRSIHLYHVLLTMSWPRFFVLILCGYLFVNVVFAMGYLLCGPGALAGGEAPDWAGRFVNAFFFSVQTVATIGYGKMTPEGVAANLLVAIEALLGLLGFALGTGLLFARFSRPSAHVVFSRGAVIAPYRGGRTLMFRIANGRSNELTDVSAVVTVGRLAEVGGRMIRKFDALRLERDRIVFFSLQWVLVHPIDRASPLAGMTEEQFRASKLEVFVLLTAMDETFSQVVHTRTSYRFDEIDWGAKFRDVHSAGSDGALRLDVSRLDETETVVLPEGDAWPQG
ncbi:MAG: transporter [Acidobacteria bacterium]|nr:transporter [Acidobacteriota bacterium]